MRGPGWVEAEVRELRPGLLLLESAVDDFDVRAALVLGRDRALVWDTLAHPEPMRPAVRLLEGRQPVVAYSHADWDHVWGTGAFDAVGQVLGLPACAARFAADVPEELAGRRRAEPGRWDDVRLVPPDRTFEEAAELDLGGLSVRLMALPGHTVDCAVAWIEAWGVLLAGDAVETPLPVVNDGTALGGWIAGLRRWTSEPALRLVVPSHGPPGGVEVVERTVAYLEGLRAGEPPPLPDDAPSFYRRTHDENLRAVGRR